MSVTDDEYRAMHQQHTRERYGTPTSEKKNELLRLRIENEQLRALLARSLRCMDTWMYDTDDIVEQAKALGVEVNE